jgi:hypothetical protein
VLVALEVPVVLEVLGVSVLEMPVVLGVPVLLEAVKGAAIKPLVR